MKNDELIEQSKEIVKRKRNRPDLEKFGCARHHRYPATAPRQRRRPRRVAEAHRGVSDFGGGLICKMVVFTLTMPNRGSWNGRWSGENRVYARTRHNKFVPKSILGKDFYYSWTDGWTACVSVEKMDSRSANKLMKRSVGFSGYDWMIDSIIKHGEILTRDEQERLSTIKEAENERL